MMIKDLCPGCGKHCYLNEARCERGIEYANTGIMPPRRPRPDGGHGKKHSEEKMKYLALDTEAKIAWNIRELAEVAYNADAPALTEGLREEDCAVLLMLLEKVKFEHKRRNRERMEG